MVYDLKAIDGPDLRTIELAYECTGDVEFVVIRVYDGPKEYYDNTPEKRKAIIRNFNPLDENGERSNLTLTFLPAGGEFTGDYLIKDNSRTGLFKFRREPDAEAAVCL